LADRLALCKSNQLPPYWSIAFFIFFLNQPKYIYIALFNQKSMHTITNLQIKPGQTTNHISSVMAGKFFFQAKQS